MHYYISYKLWWACEIISYLIQPDNDFFLTYHIIYTFNYVLLNSFLASDAFYCMLDIFTNGLDANQDRQNISPDLDPARHL